MNVQQRPPLQRRQCGCVQSLCCEHGHRCALCESEDDSLSMSWIICWMIRYMIHDRVRNCADTRTHDRKSHLPSYFRRSLSKRMMINDKFLYANNTAMKQITVSQQIYSIHLNSSGIIHLSYIDKLPSPSTCDFLGVFLGCQCLIGCFHGVHGIARSFDASS